MAQLQVASHYSGSYRPGLGAYPDQPYYDPNRPSWLPYWIDDFTESEAKYNADNLLQATVNAGAMAAGSVVGGIGTGIGTAINAALGGMSLGTIAVLAGLGFIIYTAKK